MKKIRQFIFSPKGTTAIFGMAIALLLLSSIGGANAALTLTSLTHETEISTQEIGVTLLENGKAPGDAGLLSNLLSDGEEKVKTGKKYSEVLSVKNNGQIDQYVRVTIYKYWVKEADQPDGSKKETKVTNVWPGYIKLEFAEGWVEDPKASTPERTVIYYTKPIKANEEVNFATELKISSDVAGIVSVNDQKNISYDYKDLEFKVDVEVNAVQTHHAADAILSTWGCKVDNSGADKDGVLKELKFQW